MPQKTNLTAAAVYLVAMELPGGIPPDRDSSYSCQTQQIQQQPQQPTSSSNLNTSSSSGQHSLSSSIGVSIQQQPQQQSQPICERLSRPMSFDKVSNHIIFIVITQKNKNLKLNFIVAQ